MRDSGTYKLMYMNALIGLENGHLMPWDKDILASAPLPDSVIDPYSTKEMPDILESMKLTFNAMSIWVDEAKKVNYFSKRFVQLSRMVMNGVTTMGRGLVTLHARGEDLSQSPMSIQDLLGVASYHFRKSYLGVLQTSRSHPEIGERLLMNQIGWNNMLMRLFKTRDKLNSGVMIQVPGSREDQGARIQDSGIRDQGSVASGQCSGSKEQETQGLPDTSDLLLQALSERTHTSDLKSPISTLTAPSAIREPGALTAPRAFSSYDHSSNKRMLLKATVKSTEDQTNGEKSFGTEHTGTGNLCCEANTSVPVPMCSLETAVEKKEDDKETETKEVKTDNKLTGAGSSAQDASPRVHEDRGDSPMKGKSPPSEMPPYLQIMKNVFARSGPSENGELTFTFDELCYLAADSDFNRVYPDQAAQMRSILQNLNSS